jgi:hypothetical protein
MHNYPEKPTSFTFDYSPKIKKALLPKKRGQLPALPAQIHFLYGTPSVSPTGVFPGFLLQIS